MPLLADRQERFAAALADPALPVPAGLVGPDGLPSARRFAVYRNNVAVALADALAANFPVVKRLVGDAFFRAMALQYARNEPPRSPMLFEYGASFADFVEQFPPAASLPYLADVARIERAWLESYHAPEASAVGPDDLARIPENEIPETCFILHSSLRVIRSDFPALTIWQMNVGDRPTEPIELGTDREDALILRPQAEVEAHLMPPGAFEFLDGLLNGLPLQRAAKAALVAAPDFELSSCIRELVAAGAFVSFGTVAGHRPFKDGTLT